MKKYDNFCKALANLKEGAVLDEPYTVVEQTGIVWLFAICFEQSWKMMKELLEMHGRFEEKIGSPRAIIKTAYQCGMIDDEALWRELLNARNLLTHTYSSEQSLSLIHELKNEYISAFEDLKCKAEQWINE
ncbi:MAG: nucleotidyltransferase substrate binding protein [Clostridiales bacterium]|nr:nucleotidyltransferase substrate binding protein [Clostridiales bacterium]